MRAELHLAGTRTHRPPSSTPIPTTPVSRWRCSLPPDSEHISASRDLLKPVRSTGTTRREPAPADPHTVAPPPVAPGSPKGIPLLVVPCPLRTPPPPQHSCAGREGSSPPRRPPCPPSPPLRTTSRKSNPPAEEMTACHLHEQPAMGARPVNRTSSLQAIITPEEPARLPEDADKPSGGCTKREPPAVDSLPVRLPGTPEAPAPLLGATKDLKMHIVRVMDKLKAGDAQDLPRDELLAVLDRSLSAISHWSLQAQLAQLSQSKSVWDSRLLVENNLIKKEAEFFKKRLEQAGRPAGVEPPSAGRVAKRPLGQTPRKRQALLDSPQGYKLVENTKPHPRMRRHMDNPSTSGFVRVFHLERL
ncbi:AaceriAFR162Cp [[Ashbya] aceris (nom. inval.)]|nr:AaceriAFR162Cp [[Ashbya] aceris (nom. inval.)]